MTRSARTFLILLAVALPALPAAMAQDCPLTSVAIVSPRDGATLYVDESASLEVNFEAEPGCVAETENIEFFLAQPGSTNFTSIGVDTAFPYRTSYTFLAMTFDEPWTLRVAATPTDGTTEPVQLESTFTFVAVGNATDSNGNGLPDAPFAALNGTTDTWRATGQFADAAFTLLGAASAMYGYTIEQAPFPDATSITLASPHNPGQTLTVKASQSLLAEGERGVLIVAMAPDAISLMGSTHAARADGVAPSTALDPDAEYIHVSLIISDDNGVTFNEVPDTRLADHPIELTLSGLDLVGGEDYTLARYPAYIKDFNNVVRIATETGTWKSVTNQGIDYETGTLTADLTTMGLFAPFQQADVGTVTDTTGTTTFWMILSPILLALGILQAADGGGPCFIATAAYGTPMAGDINTLRLFRDKALLTSAAGSLAVDTYYRLSPPIADGVAASPLLAAIVRVALVPVVWIIRLTMSVPPGMWPLLVLVAALLALRRRRKTA